MPDAPALVSTDWVAQQMLAGAKNNVRIVDASWKPSTDTRQDYVQRHLTGAQFFDINKCKAHGGELNLSLTIPSADNFAEYVGSLGIENDSHVIVYEDNTAFGVYSAPRVWWMFRAYGHSNVSVMDGGLPLWVKEGRQTSDVVSTATKASFNACFNPVLLKTFSDIETNLKMKTHQVVDVRPEGMFNGTVSQPRPDCVSGHMPDSVNIPLPIFLAEDQNGIKRYKTADQLRQTFTSRGVDLAQPIVVSCWAGLTSCGVALAAYLAGKEGVPLFGGSWEEYSLRMVKINPGNII